jgi:hypothetical protein
VVLDFIDEVKKSKTMDSVIKEAASKAWLKLTNYYSKTDDSNVYAIATAMDPRLKYSYWEENEWESAYQEDAKQKVETEWMNYKVEYDVTSTGADIDRKTFGKFKLKRRRVLDELEKYLTEACSEEDDDGNTALSYWSRSTTTFPELSKMARKYLAIPATSTPCERLFSKAKHFIPASRNRLKNETFKQSVLVESWLTTDNNV